MLPPFVRIGDIAAEQFGVGLVAECLAPPLCGVGGGAFLHRNQVRFAHDGNRDRPDLESFGPFDHRIERGVKHDLNWLAAAVPEVQTVTEVSSKLKAGGDECLTQRDLVSR